MMEKLQARLVSGATKCAKRYLGFRIARRLIKQQDGATTVEFALVVAPFLACLFAILETAMVFFAGQTLETANSESARLIMTGQAQTSGYNQASFKNAVCSRIFAIFDCQNGLYVDVKTYTSFASISTANPIDSSGNLQTASFGYTPGGPGDIVVVRLMYKWPTYVSLLGLSGMSNLSGNYRLIMSTVAFRNEPYS